jgi:hypothetical protein
VQEAGCAPGPVWTGAENLATTRIRFADRPARSQSLYQLSYPAYSIPFHLQVLYPSKECPTRYGTRHFFSNFTTNEDIETKLVADYRHVLQTRATDTR